MPVESMPVARLPAALTTATRMGTHGVRRPIGDIRVREPSPGVRG